MIVKMILQVLTVLAILHSILAQDSSLPNIIFMMADDLGYGDVSYNGGKAQTPHLDEMAQGSHTIHLTRYYSGSPVCSPTRGTVLTGRNHNRYCIWYADVGSDGDDFVIPQRMPLPGTEVTVAEILKSEGYQTSMIGKWHLGDLKAQKRGNPRWPVSHPGMHGFDEWLVTGRSSPTHNTNCACFNDTNLLCLPLGHYITLPPCSNYYSGNDSVPLQEPTEGDDSQFILDKFEQFLNKTTESSAPFFIYLAFHSVHERYIASENVADRYLSMGYDRNHADYYGAITGLDNAIGGVRRLLQEHNISHNTMLWFTSDNGPLGSTPGRTHGYRGTKGTLYEGGIRVPGLIEWPAMIHNQRTSNFPVVSSDLLPTVSDIVGTDISHILLDGVSILPMIRDERSSRNSSIKWAFKVPANFSGKFNAAISDDRYKVHVTYNNDRVVEAALYDLIDDPFETSNIAEENVEVFESIKQELEDWRLSVLQSAQKSQCYGNFSGDYNSVYSYNILYLILL